MYHQLPPTILSSKGSASKTKVKVKPIPLPDALEAANNAEAEVTVDTGGDGDDTELEDVTEALGQTAVDQKRTELRAPRTLETTLFDRLERIYGPGIKRLLAVQYR